MIVYLDDEIFADSTLDPLTLPALFKAADRGRHRLQIVPPWNERRVASKSSQWLSGQPAATRYKEILKRGLEQDSKQYPCDVRVRIRKTPNSRSQDPIELDAETALQLLQQPFEVLVEHFENDWRFLKLLAGDWAPFLSELQREGVLKSRHGGGDTLKGQVEAVHPLRSFVLFDSDSRLPPAEEKPRPSVWSEAVRTACTERKLAHHQLRRRAAENYLPRQAISGWVSLQKDRKKDLLKTYKAFVQMSDLQRHHYPLREGFAKDQNDPCLAGFGEFAHLPELRQGFGKGIRDLFLEVDFQFKPEWMERDCGPEAKEITLKLLRRL